MGYPVIVVSGIPRSGTSLMMQLLQAGGIGPFTDEVRRADKNNPRGYFEHKRAIGLRRDDTPWLSEVGDKAVKIIYNALFHLPSSYGYKVIFMVRNFEEIVASHRAMAGPQAGDEKYDSSLPEFYREQLQVVRDCLSERPEFKLLYVNHHDVLRYPEVVCSSVNCFLEKKVLTPEIMLNVVEDSLYRNRCCEPWQRAVKKLY